MSIRLLEHMRDELIATGIVQNTPEFCRSWLGRSENAAFLWPVKTRKFQGLRLNLKLPPLRATPKISHSGSRKLKLGLKTGSHGQPRKSLWRLKVISRTE